MSDVVCTSSNSVSCLVDENFPIDKVLELHRLHPNAKFISHPESEPHILKVSSHIGSTKGMIDFVKQDHSEKFMVATEAGIMHQMRMEAPNKTLIPAPTNEDNTCVCSECPHMKMNTLEKLYRCLVMEGA